MADSWKLTAFGDKATIQDALLAQEDAAEWDPEVVLTGFELADDRPDDWRLDAYFPRQPAAADRAAVKALFAGKAPRLTVEKLPDADWVTESQQGIEPLRAGRFHVHTPDHPPSDEPGVTSLISRRGTASIASCIWYCGSSGPATPLSSTRAAAGEV